MISGARSRVPGAGGGGGGSLVHGGTLTFSGSGFGARASPSPTIFDDFSLGTVGQPVVPEVGDFNDAVYGQWLSDDRGGNTSQPTYGNGKYLTAGRAALCDYRFGGGATYDLRPLFKSSGVTNGTPIVPGDKLVDEVTFNWERLAGQTNFSRNWKLPRWQAGSPDDPNNFRRFQCVFFPTGINNFELDGGPNMGAELETLYDEWAEFFATGQGGYLPNEDEWHTYSVYLHESSVDTANGGFKVYWNNHDMAPSSTAMSGIQTRESGANDDDLDGLQFPHYYAVDTEAEEDNNCDMDLYVDSRYIDKSWQQVFLGNADTWAASNKRHFQPQSARSDTEITLGYLNQGRFEIGEDTWRYVMLDDGTIQPGVYAGQWVAP